MLSACFYVSFYTLCVFFFFSLPAFGSHLIFQVASSLYKVSTPQRWNEEQQISNYIAFELQTDGMPSKWQTRTFLSCNDNGFVFFPSKTSKTHSEWMNVENASVHELPQCVWMCRYPRLNWNILNCDTQSMRTNASKSHFEWCVLHLSSAMLHTYTHGGWWWLVRLFRPKQVFGVVWFILRFNPLCVTWRRSMCISWFQSTGSLTVRVCFASSWIDCIVWIP